MFELEFQARLRKYEGAGSWFFLTLPADASAEVHAAARGTMKPGGSVRVSASIGRTRWKTSLFWDSKKQAFLLPVKAAVRTNEQLRDGDLVAAACAVELPGPAD